MTEDQELYFQVLSRAFDDFGIDDFSPEEFAPFRRPPPQYHRTLAILPTVSVLQDMRDAGCGPITVNSGYRDPGYNESVGGARESQHILFTAADVTTRDWSPDEVFEWLDGHHNRKGIALGRYKTFTHIDTRHWYGNPQEGWSPARWDNR